MMEQFQVWPASDMSLLVLVVDQPIRHGLVMMRLA